MGPRASSGRCVVVRLHEGLGNQLFQLAAGVGVAERLGVPVHVLGRDEDLAGLDAVVPGVAVAAPAALAARLRFPLRSNGWNLARTARNRALRRSGRVNHVHQLWLDPFAAPAATLPDAREIVYLDGFFQHPAWATVGLERFRAGLAPELARAIAAVAARQATVISLRRGDYVRLGWALDRAYYETALGTLDAVDGPVWVVGDDPLANDAIAMLAARSLPGVEAAPRLLADARLNDLALLAGAARVVMANSTFSWWGVSLGDHLPRPAGRVVLMPGRWIRALPRPSLAAPHWTIVEEPAGD